MISDKLNTKEYNIYYKAYIDNAADENIVEGLIQNMNSVIKFYSNIPQEKHDYVYESGKWTIKDILLHIVDTERVFAYRALRIARQDKTALAGFNQDDYVVSAIARQRTLYNILEEYKAVRQSSIALYSSFNSNVLEQIGEASGFPVSVRALGYILTGHENHHIQVIKQRYFIAE